VVSDYPAGAKLESIGLRDIFDVTICAQDPDVGLFKPDPRGLIIAAGRLGVAPSEALYVGDRPEVDAVAAERAEMACAIISRKGQAVNQRHICVRSFADLQRILFG